MALIAVNGIDLNVEVVGSGSPILLLHGFTGSTVSWSQQLPSLAGRARVIAVDLIGHGRSDTPIERTHYEMNACVADLVAVLDHLSVSRSVVMGYSMGARVGLALAVTAPDRVAGLIVESGSPGLEDAAAREARRLADDDLAAAIESAGVEAFVDRWEKLPLFHLQQRLPGSVRERLRRQRLSNSAVGLANSLRGLGVGASASLWDRLPQINVPVLLVVGGLDDKYLVVGRAMQRLLPRASLAVVPNAGHNVHLERPAEFNQLVAQYLSEHDLVATSASGGPRR